MKTLSSLLGVLTIIGWTSFASAGFIKVDDANLASLGASQDGFNITRDLSNGLDWLDWSLTTTYSFDSSSATLLGAGQILDGWRFATLADFSGLGASAAIPAAYIDTFGPAPAPTALSDLAASLGLTRPSDQSAFAVFNEASTNSGFLRLGGITLNSVSRAIFDAPNDPPIWLNQSWGKASINSAVGMAVVRASTAAVPAPATLALFGLGLAGLGWSRRKKA